MLETALLSGITIEAFIWELTELLAVVVFFANGFSMWLPNHSKYPVVQWLLDMLNKLSLNIYRNANRLHDQLEKSGEKEAYNIDEAVQRAIKRQEERRGGAKP